MMKIVRTVLASGEDFHTYNTILRDLEGSHRMYMQSKQLHVLTDYELNIMKFIDECFSTIGDPPTIELVEENFNMEKGALERINPFEDLRSLKVYAKGVFKAKLTEAVNAEIATLGATGQTQSAEDKNRLLQLTTIDDKPRVYSHKFNFMEYYKSKLERPSGLKFPCKYLNEHAGEMGEGEVTVLAGFTSHFKSTLATNIIYHNVLLYGFNGVMFSLETPKETVWVNLLSRHSMGNEVLGGEMSSISAQKVKRTVLSHKEIELFEKVRDDWDEKRTGNLIIIDESDFETKDPLEFLQILEEVDDLLNGDLHFFCVDYIQLLKYTSYGESMSENKAVGSYMEVFRTATQGFRKGTKFEKKLAGIILSQISREGKKAADANEGCYTGTHVLSDSSELEKSSHRIVSTYTTDEMKANKEAFVQVLKARDGSTTEPYTITALGETNFYGDSDLLEGGTDEFSGELNLGEAIESALSSDGFDNSAFDIFGGGISF